MRIIAGKYVRRNLFTLKSNKTRLTSDKVKESLSNSLGQSFNGGTVLDLYGGSGALAIEAVSRGFDCAVTTDINYTAVQIIKKNVASTHEEGRFEVFKMSDKVALRFLNEHDYHFDIVFLDPPYAKQKITEIMAEIDKLNLLNSKAVLACETDDDTQLEDINGFTLVKEHHLGKTIIRIYRRDD